MVRLYCTSNAYFLMQNLLKCPLNDSLVCLLDGRLIERPYHLSSGHHPGSWPRVEGALGLHTTAKCLQKARRSLTTMSKCSSHVLNCFHAIQQLKPVNNVVNASSIHDRFFTWFSCLWVPPITSLRLSRQFIPSCVRSILKLHIRIKTRLAALQNRPSNHQV